MYRELITVGSDRKLVTSQEVSSSDDAVFDDIRPCRDEEVDHELEVICQDETLVKGLLKIRYPILHRWFGPLLRPLIRSHVKRLVANIHSIADFQKMVATYVERMIQSTTDGVTFQGFDKLDPHQGYLFISNHRDISLDPALIDYALHQYGFDTVRIAIGNNLLKMPAATSLMRLNKSFLVKRDIPSLRQKFKELNHLSQYIGLSLKEGNSIWIAQREGRAKDGFDGTDAAVLKMLGMYARQIDQDFVTYMTNMKIVPVSITYEYDPGDMHKAHELQERADNNGKYQKGEFEDIQSIVEGIKGYKGRVSIVAGEPISGNFENAEELAYLIDRFIYSNYAMYPSILLAAERLEYITIQTEPLLAKVTEEERLKFFSRIESYPTNLQLRVLNMYAAPYVNYLKVKNGELQPVKDGEDNAASATADSAASATADSAAATVGADGTGTDGKGTDGAND